MVCQATFRHNLKTTPRLGRLIKVKSTHRSTDHGYFLKTSALQDEDASRNQLRGNTCASLNYRVRCRRQNVVTNSTKHAYPLQTLTAVYSKAHMK
jgi:hypothetical protein